MTRIKDLARFTFSTDKTSPAPTADPAPTVLHITVQGILKAINDNPAVSYRGVAREIGAFTPKQKTQVAARLRQMVMSKEPYIKRLKQDGMYRYYPINHKAGTPKTETQPETAPVTDTFKLNRSQIAELVRQNSGLNYAELGKLAGAVTPKDFRVVSSRLWQMMNLKHPKVKRLMKNNTYHYYLVEPAMVEQAQEVTATPIEVPEPTEWVETAAVPKVETVTPSAAPRQPVATEVTQLAKDYYWETGNDSLKLFIEWINAKEQE